MPIKQRKSLFAGVCALGMGLLPLLSGCGGTSFQKDSFGNYPDAGPAAYGLEATAANTDLQGQQGLDPSFVETSGVSSPDGTGAYLTAGTDFKIVTGAGPLTNVDPNHTGKVPLGFATGGSYIDSITAQSAVTPTAVAPGTSVVFRAAISNGVSSTTRSTIPIQYNGVTLTSSDPQWTLGTLPLTFNFTNAGPFANATYVTGTPVESGQGTPTAFKLPFTTTGLHSMVLTVTDTSGQKTQTTFTTVVLAGGNVAVFAQNITPDGSADDATPTPIDPGSTATITGSTGTNPQTKADAQGTVILFTTPGTQTLTVTSADGKTVTNQTLDLTKSAGKTVIQ